MQRLLLIAVATVSLSCETVQTTQPGVVGVDREQRMLVSEEELRKGAELAYREVLTKEQQRGALNADPALTNRVRGIVQRLVPHTAAFRPDAPGWKWEANVIRSDQVNAWVMPGGKMAVYSGLITRLGLSDDELAAVLGHEMAHALREHARERASRQVAGQMAVGIGAAVLGVGQVGEGLANMAFQYGVLMPNSRTQEVEADRIGVEIAARAGFDPRAAVTLWQKMHKAGGAAGPEWLSTHPSPENRLRDLEAYAARVMPLYQQAKR
ncbi:MAG TPA: M48 family metallopeptidase [Burkholderiaceae bacterium]|nr:M48 family metallopeptidase [Burkholderiaceae bacterium]